MNILFITTTLGTRGGIQRVTTVKANAFADIEDNKVAIAFYDKLDWPENAIHPLSEKVKVYDMESPFWDREPKRFDIFWRFPMKAIKLRKKIRAVIKDFQPDVVISTGQFEKFILPWVKPFNRKFALIREYHFASEYRQVEDLVRRNKVSFRSKLINWFENKFLSRGFDCNYLLTKQDMNLNFKDAKRYDFMHNPASFPIANHDVVRSKEKIVVAIGRITHPKNFQELIKIWAITDTQDWKLRILGTGEKLESLKSLARELKITDSVEIAGYSDKIKEECERASIIAGTSTFEGFMLVLVEGMSQGCVPISFDTHFGPGEIIQNGVNGYITPMHDQATFAKLLSELIANQQLREEMAHKAIDRAKDFDIESITEKWMEKYKHLLAKRRR